MQPQIDKFGDNGILIRWPQTISNEIYYEILSLNKHLQVEFGNVVTETIIAYNSIAAFLDESVDVDQFLLTFHLPEFDGTINEMNSVTYVVPVCYEAQFAIDLPRVAEHCQLREEEIILLHTSVTYDVRFIGFLPGFPYLSGLDRRLHTPRIPDPRKHIEKGSVAIGGEQTGIYTMDSPGGWNIIGKSPLNFFNVHHNPPSLFQPGDKVQFEAVSAYRYQQIEELVNQGQFEIQKIV